MLTERILLLTIASLIAAVPAAGDDDTVSGVDRGSVINAISLPQKQLASYASWKKLTESPIKISQRQYAACEPFPVSPLIEATVSKMHGPHWTGSVQVYANATAAATIQRRIETFPNGRIFPIGSIVVKEKLLNGKLDAVTAMIKKPDSYDKSKPNIDWQFVFWSRNGDAQQGRIESCRNCHQHQRDKDFLFLQQSPNDKYSRDLGKTIKDYIN